MSNNLTNTTLRTKSIWSNKFENPNKLIMKAHNAITSMENRDRIRIAGYAAFFNNIDHHKHMILPGAFAEEVKDFNKNQKPLLLLAHHADNRPLSRVSILREDEKGLYMEATIKKDQVEPLLWHQINSGLLSALSVAIIPIVSKTKTNYKEISKCNLIEISVVAVGANPMTKIETLLDF